MALPTFPTAYTTHKNIHEAQIARRRDMDARRVETWGNTSSYYKRAESASAMQSAWTSDKSFARSMKAYQAERGQEETLKLLADRRLRLARLIESESRQFEAELRALREAKQREKLDSARDEVGRLKSARTERDKQVASEKYAQVLSENDPNLRDIQKERQRRYVESEWGKQILQKEEQLSSAVQDEMEFEKLVREAREREREADRAVAEKRQTEARDRNRELREQIEAFRIKEREAEALRREEERLVAEHTELERIEQERRQRIEEARRREHGRALLRQHSAALRRRAQEVQRDLEEDRRLLEKLAKRDAEERVQLDERRDRERADAAWMKRVVEEQLRVEKEREAELDALFAEESARLWSVREAEWRKEREAREALLNNVLRERAVQLSSRIEDLREAQRASRDERESMLAQVERVREQLLNERRNDVAQTERQRDVLGAQMDAKRREQVANARLEERETQAANEERAAYDEFLRAERERLANTPFEPKHYGRPKANFSAK